VARVDPLPPEHTPELNEEFDSFFKTLGFVPNSVLTMQRKPKLAKAFVQMQRALWDPDSKVDRGLKRLLAHAAARASDDLYSMAHTASGALHFGITPAERAALDLATAASATPNAVNDAVFAEARKHWSEEQIVEILGVVAMAGFLSLWNVSMQTPLEPEPSEVGEKHLAALGWRAGAHGRT
jgi:hypothetical protein